MAIFSNLEGTMQKTFILGKNGARLSTDGTEFGVQNAAGTNFLPVQAGSPVKPEHLVTLEYFNQHGGSGTGNLSGRTVPDVSLGVNGDTYYQVDDTDVVGIFFKDQDIWKPFKKTPPITDSDYVTQYSVSPQDFSLIGGVHTYILPESTHKRGSDLLIQVQDPDGNTVQPNIEVDSFGNITMSLTDVPSTSLIIKLIGVTTMTAPYSSVVDKNDWVQSGEQYNLSITAATHGQAIGPLYLAIYENDVDGPVSASPFNLVGTDTAIDSAGNVVFTSYAPFSGKLVISGK